MWRKMQFGIPLSYKNLAASKKWEANEHDILSFTKLEENVFMSQEEQK